MTPSRQLRRQSDWRPDAAKWSMAQCLGLLDEAPAKTILEFQAAQDQSIEQLRRANGIAHERRNHWQAWQVGKDLNYPAA